MFYATKIHLNVWDGNVDNIVISKLQSWKKYMRQTLVFMSNRTIRENFNFYFSAIFFQYQKHFEFRGKTEH